MKPRIRLLFASVFLFGASQHLWADDLLSTPSSVDPQEPSPEAREVVKEVQKNRDLINEREQEKRKILGSLYELSKRMKKISQEKGEMVDRLLRTQGSVKYVAKDIAKIENKIAIEKKQLRTSLRNLYKLSGETYFAILFSQETPLTLDRSLKFLKILSEKDFELIKSYERSIVDLKVKRGVLNTQVKKLVNIEGDIKKQEALLLSEHDQKAKIASDIESRKLLNVEKIKSLRNRAQDKRLVNYDAALSDLLKTAFYESKGQLTAPVQGEVVQDFGLTKHEEFPIEFSHKGWLYSTAKSAQVISIYDGRVSFAGEIKGYGETIIVDHGDHYYSVYSHLGQVKVRLNESVKKSQIIATASSTTSPNSVGIYFEIRHFSEPENPKNWILPPEVKVSASPQN